MVLWPLPCEFCRVWASTSKVINEISVKFAWVFQYMYSFRRQFRREFSTVFYVILQVPSAGTTIQTSILNRLPRNFAGTIGWYYGDCPVNYVKFERILQKLLMRFVWNLIEYFKSYLFRRQFRREFSTVFYVILQVPSAGTTATAQ